MTWLTVGSGDFACTEGAPAVYRSSAEVERGFRAACGTTMTYRNDGHPEEVDVSVASLDDPAAVTPQDHIFIASKVPWIHLDDGLPQLAGSHWQHGYPEKE